MKIFVRLPCHTSVKRFFIEVKKSDTILKLKEEIQTRDLLYEYPPARQSLYYGGAHLEDKRTLADYNIQHEATLLLNLKDIPEPSFVTIKLLNGTEYDLDVKPNVSVRDLKGQLSKVFKTPTYNMVLVLFGKELVDEEELIIYRKVSNLKIKLIRAVEDRITLSVLYGKNHSKSIQVEVRPIDTATNVKLMIQTELGVSFEKQKLLLLPTEITLRNGKYLYQYDIPSVATVILKEEKIKVHIKFLSGLELAIKVLPSDSIKDLKKEIKRKEGIPPERQKLIFKGRPIVGNEVLARYNIVDGSKVFLVLNLNKLYKKY